MKPIYVHFGGALALSFTLAACVPAPDSTPEPQPSPTQVPVTVVPAPTPTPTPVTSPAPDNWLDLPRTAGDWHYIPTGIDGAAEYRATGGSAVFSISCIRNQRRVSLTRRGKAEGATVMRIRTETATRSLEAADTPWGVAEIGASLSPNDPLLDAMALTRGRFAVETPGLSTLYLPAWAEVTRVIEDCR